MCIYEALLRGKAGFLMASQTTCKSDALLCGKAGFLMMRQKRVYLMFFNVDKHLLSRLSHDVS